MMEKRLNICCLLLFLLLVAPLALMAQKRDSVMFGVASYYHSKFNGRKTSNGEIFRNDSLTAAHKYLPFGTRVKVTNLVNDSVVIVRINDRLPQNSKRSIDLSQAAARKLNMMKAGIVKARIEILPVVKPDTIILVNNLPPGVTSQHDSDSVKAVSVDLKANNAVEPPSKKETYKEGDAKIEKVFIDNNGMQTVYTKKTWDWGGIFYFKNDIAISQEVYEKETGIK